MDAISGSALLGAIVVVGSGVVSGRAARRCRLAIREAHSLSRCNRVARLVARASILAAFFGPLPLCVLIPLFEGAFARRLVSGALILFVMFNVSVFWCARCLAKETDSNTPIA